MHIWLRGDSSTTNDINTAISSKYYILMIYVVHRSISHRIDRLSSCGYVLRGQIRGASPRKATPGDVAAHQTKDSGLMYRDAQAYLSLIDQS
jgi:hypothetical protein